MVDSSSKFFKTYSGKDSSSLIFFICHPGYSSFSIWIKYLPSVHIKATSCVTNPKPLLPEKLEINLILSSLSAIYSLSWQSPWGII